jgi:hypothetical protein
LKRSRFDDTLRCRHTLDQAAIRRLIDYLQTLPAKDPGLLRSLGIRAGDFSLYFNSAIQSIRGTTSASTSEKRRFVEAVLDHMKRRRSVQAWEYVGTKGRQDYRLVLRSGKIVGIEAKGCPDGNNMNIWERPAWAEEFVVWSQCPESLAKQPGQGVWSGIATRLLTKMVAERVPVDALVFFDGRCGSNERRCWKKYGAPGIRSAATDIRGQEGRDWLPPPCIYLFPRTVPKTPGNPRPALHTVTTCQFASAALDAFGVPAQERKRYLHWASIELRQDHRGSYKRIRVGHELGGPPVVGGEWTKLKRE